MLTLMLMLMLRLIMVKRSAVKLLQLIAAYWFFSVADYGESAAVLCSSLTAASRQQSSARR
ncbi:MAG: hypothetical protein FJY65_03455 [Calditrichaeota bacterium]|nr:hypothetical protein [Calditrichota bacterium]